MIFLSLLLCFLTIGTSKKVHKTSVILNPTVLNTDSLFSRLWDCVCFPCFVDIQRTKCSSKGKISLTINKSFKHGTISLALPSNLFTVDLTVCMDISPNPGPASPNISMTELSHHRPHTASSSVVAPCRRKCSQRLLKSLRFSSQTKYINNSMIRRFGILKPCRGCRGGKSLRFRECLNEYLSILQCQQPRRQINILKPLKNSPLITPNQYNVSGS